MAFSVIANTGGGGNGASVTSGGINTTGANVAIVGVVKWRDGSGINAAVGHFTDSNANTWNKLTNWTTANGLQCVLAWSVLSSVGAGHTFTYNDGGSESFPSLAVLALSGAHASPFDQQSGTNGGSGTSAQPGSITAVSNDQVFVTIFLIDSPGSNGNSTIDSGFTISNQTNFSVGQWVGSALAYKIQTTAGAENPTWTPPGSATRNCAMATFLSASGTGVAGYLGRRLLSGVG